MRLYNAQHIARRILRVEMTQVPVIRFRRELVNHGGASPCTSNTFVCKVTDEFNLKASSVPHRPFSLAFEEGGKGG